MTTISSLLCLYVSPEAIGSGIPEVKAYLNGVRVKRFSSLRLLIVKFVATILSISSGLAIGKEGPSIHIGAIIGAFCTKLSNILLRYVVPIETWIFGGGGAGRKCCYCCCCCDGCGCSECCGGKDDFNTVGDDDGYNTTNTNNNNKERRKRKPKPYYTSRIATFVTTELSQFSNDAERRDLVGIGAAAGFAASFGAPIGGLLFCLEATSSYYESRMFLRTLVGTSVATFCMALYHNDLSNYSIINLGIYDTPNDNIFLNRVEELPLYCIVGVVGGILGGTFVHCWKHVQLLRSNTPTTPQQEIWTKLRQVMLLSLVSSTIMYFVPLMEWTCHENKFHRNNSGSGRVGGGVATTVIEDIFHSRQFDCPDGQINNLANIMFGSRLNAISSILTDPNQFTIKTLVTVGIVFYPLMTVSLGVAIPSGT